MFKKIRDNPADETDTDSSDLEEPKDEEDPFDYGDPVPFFDDDEEGNRAEWYEELLEAEIDDPVYGQSHSAPWWHGFEDYEKACKKFLMCLAVNPMWYMTLLHGDHTVRCCYCPFHKRFEPYFRKMNVQFFLEYEKYASSPISYTSSSLD